MLLSVLLDGGISYLLIRGIRSLIGKHEENRENEAYLKALAEIEQKLRQQAKPKPADEPGQQESRGYSKTRSR